MPHIIFIGCQGEKWGGTRTYVESLRDYLSIQKYNIIYIPKRKDAKSSYSCLARIKLDCMRMKLPSDAIAIAQRPDDLFIFKTFKRKNKSICVLHGDNLRKMELKRNKLVSRIFRSMERRGLKMADKVICVDKSTYDVYIQRFPWLKSKTCVIPVGVNTSVFKPLDRAKCRHTLDIPENSRVMLVAARLEKEKNVDAAILMVKTHLDDVNNTLLIAGSGKEEKSLKELAREVKNARVMFLGQVPYPKLPDIINASDVVLVPSLFESGPLIIIEAMACGIPSVSTDVGRARLYIGDSGCGAVVKAVDEQFAQKVKGFMASNASMKMKCMERVKSFSFHNTGAETLRLIRELE